MLRRVFPHPILSLTLVIVWLMLVNKVTPGNTGIRPQSPPMRRISRV